jgi:cold shock CspA family protein
MATTDQSPTFVGRVKWFNNKVGYGFITVTDGPKSGTDVFVNHRKIKTDPDDQYKYLVQGEYVEFVLQAAEENGNHEFQAGQVCGIKGGKLMCETRLQVRESRVSYSKKEQDAKVPVDAIQEEEVVEPVKKPRSRAPPKKDADSKDKKDWTKVTKKVESKK